MHEWIEGFEEYEAVLVCTNELPAWEADAAMRAFAIYQWTDATTAGDDASLRHNEFGTIIRYDGGVLAIDFGHGSLNDALPDLFLALHALGWRGSEVYHPASSINDLLADMGRAIPASLDFDVQPARIKQAISESSEGQMFINGVNRLNGNAAEIPSNKENENATILETFRDLGAETDMSTSPSSLHKGVVNLIDDDTDEDEGGDHVVVQQFTGNQQSENMRPVIHDFDETPIIPDLTTITNLSYYPESLDVDLASEEELTTEKLGSSGELDQYSEISETPSSPLLTHEESNDNFDYGVADETVEVIKTESTHIVDLSNTQKINQAVITNEIIPAEPIAENHLTLVTDGEPPKAIKVGKSVFCFDLPSYPLTREDIQKIVMDYQIPANKVTHIIPGALNAPVRWDFLGEIDLDYPWLIENLVDLMMPNADRQLISSIFLAVIKEKPLTGLRDVLMFAGKEQEEMAQMLNVVSPAAEMLLKHAASRDYLNKTIDVLVERLGALALTPSGQSFVDLLPSHDELSKELQENFTVREVMLSANARLFVVHVDVLDSKFVSNITESLQYVATLHSESKRYCMDETIVTDVTEDVVSNQEAAIAQINTEVCNLLGPLLEQLQKLGVSIPQTDQTN